MKKIMLTSLVALFAIPVAANAGWYVAGNLSTNFAGEQDSVVNGPIDMFDTTAINAAVGYAFENGIRLEADVMRHTISANTDTDFELALTADNGSDFGLFSAKILYDFNNESEWTPYVGAGVTNLSWHNNANIDQFQIDGVAILGVSYELTTEWALFAEYNRNFAAAVWFGDDSDSESQGWSTWKVGAAYKF